MKRRVFTGSLALGALWGPSLLRAQTPPALKEVPSLADQVKSGALPPIDKRIPTTPDVVKKFSGSDGIGQYGGEINMLVAGARDTRLMTLYANARLIVYDEYFKLRPDILESYEDKGGKEFTFKLRAGHKWSDLSLIHI